MTADCCGPHDSRWTIASGEPSQLQKCVRRSDKNTKGRRHKRVVARDDSDHAQSDDGQFNAADVV